MKKKSLLLLICANFSILLFALFYKYVFTTPAMSLFECKFHSLFGFYCMGCGGSRAVFALLDFKFVRSFLSHPSVIITSLIILYTDIILFLYFTSSKKRYLSFINYKIYLIIPVSIVLQFIIKNIMLTFGFDLIKHASTLNF